MVCKEILHYNDWCLYTWLYFVLAYKTEGRQEFASASLQGRRGEAALRALKAQQPILLPLNSGKAPFHVMLKGIPFGSDANP